jgi:hypothetical protein
MSSLIHKLSVDINFDHVTGLPRQPHIFDSENHQTLKMYLFSSSYFQSTATARKHNIFYSSPKVAGKRKKIANTKYQDL